MCFYMNSLISTNLLNELAFSYLLDLVQRLAHLVQPLVKVGGLLELVELVGEVGPGLGHLRPLLGEPLAVAAVLGRGRVQLGEQGLVARELEADARKVVGHVAGEDVLVEAGGQVLVHVGGPVAEVAQPPLPVLRVADGRVQRLQLARRVLVQQLPAVQELFGVAVRQHDQHLPLNKGFRQLANALLQQTHHI